MTVSVKGDSPRISLDKVVEGTIFISNSALGSVVLDGVERIEGNIDCTDKALQSLSSDSLISIGGSLKLHGLSNLTRISFPNLLSLDILDLEDVPNLSQLELVSNLIYVSTPDLMILVYIMTNYDVYNRIVHSIISVKFTSQTPG